MRSEAGSSIIPPSENRFPKAVLERLREVKKVWIVKDASASVVHSPSGPTSNIFVLCINMIVYLYNYS